MNCIVQKFGGTSVATIDRIKHIAEIIAKTKERNLAVVAVVSAMAGTTNKIINYAQQLYGMEGNAEYDTVVSSGELITAGLLALALDNIGILAKSYSAWQIPIITDNRYGQAMIKNIGTDNLFKDINSGIVPVVCGFQGINFENRMTTLGRGGSDFTAVAIASALNADICEIYSDVDGVYTVDPNIYPSAKCLSTISYPEMLTMASQGAKVLQEQSVQYALDKKVVIRVASSLVNTAGTIISERIPQKKVCGMAIISNLAHIKFALIDEIYYNDVLALLKSNFINADIYKHDHDCVIISLDKKKLSVALDILGEQPFILYVKRKSLYKSLSKISLVCAADDILYNAVVDRLTDNKIDIFFSCQHTDRIDIVVPSMQLLSAVRILHKECGLDK